MHSGFWYLATPYSRFPGGTERAFIEACEQAAVLLKAGVNAFSPIAHSHPIAHHGGIDPLNLQFWLRIDGALCDAACGLIVCMLPTWETSVGVRQEIEWFQNNKKPILYMEPGTIPAALTPSLSETACQNRQGFR